MNFKQRLNDKKAQAAFWFLLLSATLIPVWFLSVDNDNWLPPDHPQEINLNYLSEEFSPGDDLVIALPQPKGYFSYEAMAKLSALEQALKLYLGRDLLSHRSPLSATRIANNKQSIEVESFESAFQRKAFANLTAYQKAFDKSPYAGRLLSLDYKTAAIHLRLDTRADAQKRTAVMKKVRAVLSSKGLAAGRDYHFIGKAALKNEMNEQTKKTLPVLLSGAAAVLLIFLFMVLGRIVPSLFILSVAGLCLLGGLSAPALLSHPLSVIGLILPVLALIIALAHGLHIMFYQRLQNCTPREAVAAMWKPCLWANITTGIGAGSFIFSNLVPLSNFGWDAMLMLILLYGLVMASFWFIPLWLIGKGEGQGENFIQLLLRAGVVRLARFSERHYRRIILTAAGAFVVCTIGLVRWSTETNFLAVFFKPESQIRQDFAVADKKLGGAGVVDIIVRTQMPDRFKQLEAFNQIEELVGKLPQHPQINYAEALDIPVGLAHKAFTRNQSALPNSNSQLAQELLFLELSRSEAKDDILSPYANFDYSATRLHLRTPDLSTSAIEKLIGDIKEMAAPTESLGAVVLTGFNVFQFALGKEVLTTQLLSLGITLGITFGLFLFLFGGSIGALGFLSNVVPLGILLGTLSALGVSFDVVMVLVAAITLGLMVDDSIHFIHRWRAQIAAGATPREARAQALALTGVPILLTSMLFCLGFAVFLFADLALLVKFGTWVIVGLALDALSAVVFLPALLAFWGKTG